MTDLFPAGVSRGKHVLLIYRDPTVSEEYEAVKTRAAQAHDPDERRAVARTLGRLLSYPDERIDEMLEGGSKGS